ncbi:MAG: protein kinase [Leptolyngbyaceae cyanobacterium CSU_1_3]|nr:protein kinase [Leptolyngbyaceae cyanobacterium CSU_1_3]
MLKALTHPCVPQYLDYFEHRLPIGKALALVQTYVSGKSLAAYMQMGRTFTEAEAKQIAKSLLYILIYLHGRTPATIHRDIKPSNIVLADRRTHLVNFGSVKMLLNPEGSAFTDVTTHEYTPPEQFGGRVLAASDLYSLGVTLIAIVTGKSPAHLPRKGTRLTFEQVVNLSPAFADWLSWMTEANLDRRLKSAKEALQTLEAG